MALFALVYRYTEDTELVTTHRPEHREYLRTLADRGELLAAGPLGEPGPAGGLLVFDVDSADRMEDIANNDPFQAHGVIVDRTVQSWTLSFGADRFVTSSK
jgi:uncharacterized protein YciI